LVWLVPLRLLSHEGEVAELVEADQQPMGYAFVEAGAGRALRSFEPLQT